MSSKHASAILSARKTTTTSSSGLDDRACVLLKTLVESYIAEGAPVGSRVLSRASGLDLSAATVRNVMADLEDLGFITSPHTSAGRIPTPRGYRFFVDSLLTMQPLEQIDHARILSELADAKAQPGKIINHASRLLSDLTHFAKAGMRAALNTSPEPVSNVAASVGEDALFAGGLWTLLHHPLVFLAALALFAVVAGLVLRALWGVMKKVLRPRMRPAAPR